ncbi:MAG: tryptophan 7-halogenase [Pseudomonadota bacterium]|jgi:tryptophan halogenase|uniref:Tryptophan halogenase n=1 Tax=hydrothermal vent metagenome TaxID=652676 RepID=A0A160TP28_9ZZZZ
MSSQPNRIVIVGRDAALWLSATIFRHALAPAGISVTAIELPTDLGPAATYASLPPLEALHNKLGLEESALLRATGGSFSLGHNVVGPVPGMPPFLLAHGSYGAPIDGAGFFPYWLKARRFGLQAAFEDFCLTAMAARQGRMLVPDEETELFGRTDYGYHLPALPYVATLKARAAKLGITTHHSSTIGVEHQVETGSISAILLDDGMRVEGDIFVDASGPEGILADQMPDISRDDWRPAFVANRRLTARAARFASVPAYAEIRVGASGWTALHATQAATFVSYAFALEEQDDESALAAAGKLAGLTLSDPVVTSVEQGIRHQAWSANCVAIGGAACSFDPLLDVELHAIQLGIVHLLALFPAGAIFSAERSEYNRITRSAFDRVRDFQSAFYAANRFGPTGFWAAARGATTPATVGHKLAIFRARGDIAPMEDESFAPDLWQALFTGLGEIPESWPPAIDRTPPERMKDDFRRMLGFIRRKVLEQPTHDGYLASLGRSEAA